jgi:hypothetical protein
MNRQPSGETEVTENSMVIDGHTFTWQPRSLGKATSTEIFEVFWQPGDQKEPVRLGFVRRWRHGLGWEVNPRLGGRARAQDAGVGFAQTRDVAVRRVIELARAESELDMLAKQRLRIIRKHDGALVDFSKVVEPLPSA